MKNKSFIIQISLIIIALISSYIFLQEKRMSDNWMGPYLSAAHNLEWAGSFQINLEEVEKFKSFNVVQQDNYKFKDESNLTHYNHNPIGYAYLINLAATILPFLGSQKAILILQCIFHLLISVLFLSLKELNKKQKWLFFFLYAINPIVLRFVPFNFYYFWQVIPSVIFAYLMVSEKPNRIIITFLFLLLPFIILTRPTLTFALIIIFYFLFKKLNVKHSSLLLIYNIVICIWLFQPIKKNIWHTIYTGFGAYENKYDISLNDNTTYQLYENETGEKLNASLGGNYYKEKVIDKYTAITKKESLVIINESPFFVFKNAVLNTLQGFSIGYINRGGDRLNYLIAFSGFLFILLLIYKKMYTWFLMIGFSIGTFTLFYPPIQAYMYGVYLLLVLSLVIISKRLTDSKMSNAIAN